MAIIGDREFGNAPAYFREHRYARDTACVDDKPDFA
jgi:hypothetical protein